MPLGSLTADQEMVNGTRTWAPLAGAIGVGAPTAAATPPPPTIPSTRADNTVSASLTFMEHLPEGPKEGTTISDRFGIALPARISLNPEADKNIPGTRSSTSHPSVTGDQPVRPHRSRPCHDMAHTQQPSRSQH